MSISEIHQYFKLLVNKMDTLNYQNMLPEEIDIFLNQAMFKLIENRAYGTNPKGESLEETQKRVDDLKNITFSYSTSTFTTDSNNKTNGKFVSLPSDYRHAIQEECLITYTDCNDISRTKTIEIVPITHDKYNRIKKDPFNKPYEDLVVRLPYAKVNNLETFELITDGTYTITTYYLRYLNTPTSMQYGTTYSTPTTDVDCPLSEHLHREICELAAQSVIETIESPRIQTFPGLVKTTE